MNLHSSLNSVIGLALLSLSVIGTTANAQLTEQIGEMEFTRHCAACHGLSAKGDGAVANMLTTSPPDLTQLSKKNDGHFPFFKIQEIIDGSQTILAHGNKEMPVWGERFSEQTGGPAVATTVRGRIFEVLVYLNSIQEK